MTDCSSQSLPDVQNTVQCICWKSHMCNAMKLVDFSDIIHSVIYIMKILQRLKPRILWLKFIPVVRPMS